MRWSACLVVPLEMGWRHLLFENWPTDSDVMDAHLPPQLDPDVYDGVPSVYVFSLDAQGSPSVQYQSSAAAAPMGAASAAGSVSVFQVRSLS